MRQLSIRIQLAQCENINLQAPLFSLYIIAYYVKDGTDIHHLLNS